MRARAVVLAVALVLAPLGARAADLVVWWEKGFYPQEDEAVREIIAAFEQKTGKQVELVQPAQDEIQAKIAAAFEAGQPPDFLFGLRPRNYDPRQWAYEDRLIDLAGVIGPFTDLFDPDGLELATLLDAPPADAASMRCRWGSRPTITSTSGGACWSRPGSPSPTFPSSGRRSGRSGATGCSRRCARPSGRDDICGVGLPMSASIRSTPNSSSVQFQAYAGQLT